MRDMSASFIEVAMLKNPFKSLEPKEWLLWLVSLAVVIPSNFVSGNVDPVNLLGTIIGVTALIFIAKGDVWGQILTIVFSILYAIVSFRFAYYGEVITYLGLSAPSALFAIISWLRHPYREDRNEVKIHRIKQGEWILGSLLAIAVTVLFYFLLKYFHTANLLVSTVSVTTSFYASYLTFLRSPYYALAYALNDIVLIVLWILASISDIGNLAMVSCFVMFLLNDIYGYLSWHKREKIQKKGNP